MTKRMIRKAMTTTAAALALTAMAAVPAMAQTSGTEQRPSDNGAPAEAGYGPGYGPGMMYGANGYGMGPGYGMGYHGGGYGSGWGGRGWMMGGYGMGYGPGMMWGAYGWGSEAAGALGLSDAQQKHIREIQERLGKRQWRLMQALHGQMWRLWRTDGKGGEDIDAIIKARRAMFDTRLQMLRNRLEAQKQIRAVLTEAQRKKLDELEHWRAEYSR